MVVTKTERNTKISQTTSLSTTIMTTLQFESLNLSSSKKIPLNNLQKNQRIKTTTFEDYQLATI
jgi:hypothetical protein